MPARPTWTETIQEMLGPAPPETRVWSSLRDVIDISGQLVAMATVRVMLSSGGDFYLQSSHRSREPGCLELRNSSYTAYVMRPKLLSFHYIERAPALSFFLVDLDDLHPTEVSGQLHGSTEELKEVGAHYYNRSLTDEEILGDEASNESSRLVIRIFEGKIILVGASSLWRQLGYGYSWGGSLSATELRDFLNSAVERQTLRIRERNDGPS